MKNHTIKLKVDGMDVEVSKGRTILEAAQSAGIRIPTLCHDRRLIPFGACRICVVQEKGKSELLPACFTPAKGGMEIITQSPQIFKSRRLQLQFILLNHPMICPRCKKEGDCDLQAIVYEYGVLETLYPWKQISFPVDDFSPLLQRDPNKCILCGRCARICDEVQGVGELSFTRRGIKTAIDTDFHRPIQCEFCGQCLDTCPVGAITSDCFDYTTKVWELKETTTPCPYCGCGCLLTMGSKEGEVKRVFSDPEKGPSDGNLCVKGRFGWDFIDHPERIPAPLLRVNGAFKEVSWEEALRFVAQQLEAIKEQSGPDAIGGMLCSRLTNEEYYLFGKLFREAIGTNRIGPNGDRAYRGLTGGLAKTLGLSASTNSIREIRKADCLLVMGMDPAQTHPIIKNEIHQAIRRNRAQLIVLGSYDMDLSRATQISPLSPPAITLLGRPGMEVALLNGMIGTILREGLEDKGFIEERAEGIKELRQKQVEVKVKVEEEVERAARAFARAKRSMILIGSGPWSHLDPQEVTIASSNLALITGHVGKESCGILILLEKCNTQGAIDMGVFAEGEEDEREDLFQKAEEGKVKALYLVGEDPLMTSSDSDRLRKSLANLQLLIVQDLFMTETAKMAHVVLPVCSFVEKGGTYTNLERRVQRLNPLRLPWGQSRSDFDIFLQLLRLLESSVGGETPEAVFQEMGRSVPYYRGLEDGEQWPKGLGYLYSEGFPLGKARLIPVRETVVHPIPEDYPFQLIQRPSLFRSGLLSLKSDTLKKVSEEPHLEMNPEDAQRLKIEEGEVVKVSTHRGLPLRMKVKYSSRLASQVITAPYPFPLIEEGGMVSVKVERLKRN
jgi:NADH-quinone oxidoreductase subunit G